MRDAPRDARSGYRRPAHRARYGHGVRVRGARHRAPSGKSPRGRYMRRSRRERDGATDLSWIRCSTRRSRQSALHADRHRHPHLLRRQPRAAGTHAPSRARHGDCGARPERGRQDDPLSLANGPDARRSGRVLFNGLDTTRLAPHRIHEAGISLVPQGRRIFTSLTVAENLTIAARQGRSGGAWSVDRVVRCSPGSRSASIIAEAI